MPLTYRPLVKMVIHSNATSAILGVFDSDEMTRHKACRVVITAGCIGSIAAASTFVVVVVVVVGGGGEECAV